MSVIRFGQKEMVKMEGMILNQSINKTSPIVSAIKYSKIYQIKKAQQMSWNAERFDEDTFYSTMVARLFWYLWIANKTAYALQYEEEPDFFGDYDENYTADAFGVFGKVPSGIKGLKALKSDLSSLSYNLYSNDGNMFLAGEWKEMFEAIQNAVNKELATIYAEDGIKVGY